MRRRLPVPKNPAVFYFLWLIYPFNPDQYPLIKAPALWHLRQEGMLLLFHQHHVEVGVNQGPHLCLLGIG